MRDRELNAECDGIECSKQCRVAYVFFSFGFISYVLLVRVAY